MTSETQTLIAAGERRIAEFMPPFDQEDHALERVAEVIREIRDNIKVAEVIERRAGEVPIPINPDDV